MDHNCALAIVLSSSSLLYIKATEASARAVSQARRHCVVSQSNLPGVNGNTTITTVRLQLHRLTAHRDDEY